MFKSYGYLKYDPVSSRTRYDEWWAILRCDIGLSKYYRSMVENSASRIVPSDLWLDSAKLDTSIDKHWMVSIRKFKTSPSAWGPHVSVIRGEKPLDLTAWKKYQDERVEFTYDPRYINTNGRHWWFRVKSPRLEEIRKELGLTPQPTFIDYHGNTRVNPFHFTIGYDHSESWRRKT
jgi:hypothetical protein